MLEIIAIISMLTDHAGKVFFPSQPVFYIIGRLALPLYTYGITQGFLYTSNLNRYLIRLLTLAVLSQFFYSQLFTRGQLNIIFTYVIILLFYSAYKQLRVNIAVSVIMVVLLGILLTVLRFEAGFYALVLAVIYFNKKNLLVNHLLLNLATIVLINNNSAFLQMFSLLGTILIVVLPGKRLNGTLRTVYRIFYPVHLAVLWGIKILYPR